ncbi:quinolinate synthase NadA [Agromyces sp. LHK192]|uniref:quinolinate synthase NadA n=1 Tax=Agromyces sp. LHK192 TaxID=2498704 RepID=UPI000FD9327D|nr:quinolinate synthase NadA [Agromyces sp. LHK192]
MTLVDPSTAPAAATDAAATRLAASVDRSIRLISTGRQSGGTCSPDLVAGPWDFDRGPAAYGPGASMGDVIPAGAPRQGALPEAYRRATDAELHERIRAAKQALGDRVVVLGHFYQRDEVIQHADFTGDSFQLANAALTRPDAEAIVFCGVHFMAETADILSRPDQAVILPNLAAGCSMADMADESSVEECWEQLADVYGDLDAVDADGRVPVIPVTYMNSSAALKGFVGRHGGIVCTSSNARTVLEQAFERGQRVLFFPDQHLGRNTAKAMGVPLERMPMWNPRKPLGGSTADDLADAKVILWHGFCSVHKRFTVDQIANARQTHPDVQVIVHPECPMEVVDAADAAGSTDFIVKAIAAAPAGSTFAIGTEINLVQRLAAEHPEHEIFCLDPVVCPCSTMYRIHPGYLAWVLEELVAGNVVNRITVGDEVAGHARVALERMLAAKPPASQPAATGA